MAGRRATERPRGRGDPVADGTPDVDDPAARRRARRGDLRGACAADAIYATPGQTPHVPQAAAWSAAASLASAWRIRSKRVIRLGVRGAGPHRYHSFSRR